MGRFVFLILHCVLSIVRTVRYGNYRSISFLWMVKQRKTEGKDCRGCSFSSASCFEIFVGLLCLQRDSRILKSDAVFLNDFLPLLCVGQTKGNDPFLVSSCIQTTLAILFLLFEFLSFSISFFFFVFIFIFPVFYCLCGK